MSQKFNSFIRVVIWGFLAIFILWWLYINIFLRDVDHGSLNNQIFAATYGIMALIGGIVGLVASKKWGGCKSLIGKALLFFSIGLFAQEFGQISYSFYIYALKVDIPYPSIGDIGYFSSVIFYIIAAVQLAKATGLHMTIRDRSKQLIAVIIPMIMLGGSYFMFLRGYQFDFSSLKSALTVFLDFGYPLGQALYIAIAILTYLLSKKMLGGFMKKKILLILFALVVQYAADSSFLYAAKNGKYFAAGANDLLYLLAYAALAIGLTSFLSTVAVAKPIEQSPSLQTESAG